MNLEKLTYNLVDFCSELGDELLAKRLELKSENIEHKGLHDLVTTLDKYSEKEIINYCLTQLPQSSFLAEEGTVDAQKGEYRWIIDPIDGTTNFIHGIPSFAFSIALQKNEETILGVVYEMNLKEAFHAWQGGPALLNNIPIKVSSTKNLSNSLLATGFPYTDFGKTDAYLKVFKKFMENSRGLRRLGSAATDLAYVAAGRFDGFYEYGLKPWDVAAGSFIVTQAGGHVSDFNNSNNFVFGETLLASNNLLHTEMLKTINSYF